MLESGELDVLSGLDIIDAGVTLGGRDFDLSMGKSELSAEVSGGIVLRALREHLPEDLGLRPVFILRGKEWRPVYEQVTQALGPGKTALIVPADQWQEDCAGVHADGPEQVRSALDLPSANGEVVVIDLESTAATDLETLRSLVAGHPRRRFVFASLGGQFWRFAALLAWQCAHVYLDTSKLTRRRLRAMFDNRYQLARLLHKLQDKVLFGSGFPLVTTASALHTLIPWCRDAGVVRKIVQTNARNLLAPQIH